MAFPLKHDVECFGYLIKHPESGTIVFMTDTDFCPYTFKGLNHIIIECNYSQDILDENIMNHDIHMAVQNRVEGSHMSLETCKDFFESNDIIQVNNIILTHLSNLNASPKLFKEEIQDITGKMVFIAEKGLSVDLNINPF